MSFCVCRGYALALIAAHDAGGARSATHRRGVACRESARGPRADSVSHAAEARTHYTFFTGRTPRTPAAFLLTAPCAAVSLFAGAFFAVVRSAMILAPILWFLASQMSGQ